MVMHVDGLRGRRARGPGRGALVHGHPAKRVSGTRTAEAQPDPARAEAQRAHLDGHVEDLEPTTPTDAIDEHASLDRHAVEHLPGAGRRRRCAPRSVSRRAVRC
jgi:hypothetical protein